MPDRRLTRRTLLRRAAFALLGVGLAGGAGFGLWTVAGRWLLGKGRPVPPKWEIPLSRPIIGAHRGGAAIFPEHTMAALAGCHDRFGCRFLELDVNTSRDGIPVVIHDGTVDRTTDGTGRVADLDWADLRRLDAGYRFRGLDNVSWAGRGLRIPTLAEVLERFPDCVCSIEMKETNPAGDAAVIQTIRAANAGGRVLLGSAREEVTMRLQALAPEFPTFYPFRGGLLLLLAHWMGLSRWYRPLHNALLVPNRLFGFDYINRALIETAQRLALPMLVFTVNEAAEMRRLLDMGADGIITDRPDLLAEAVGAQRATRG